MNKNRPAWILLGIILGVLPFVVVWAMQPAFNWWIRLVNSEVLGVALYQMPGVDALAVAVVCLLLVGSWKIWSLYSRATLTVHERVTGRLKARTVVPGQRLTLWEAIERDRRVNLIALAGLIVFEYLVLALIAWLFLQPFVYLAGMVLQSIYSHPDPIALMSRVLSTMALVVSVAFSAVWIVRAHRSISARLLRMAAARPLPDGELGHVRSALDDMYIAAGMDRSTDLWFIDSPAVNAMAVGMSPAGSSVAVTRGLIDALPTDELRAVFAHLVARIASGGIARSTSRAAMTASVPQIGSDFGINNPPMLLPQFVGRLAVWGSKARSELLLCQADQDALLLLKDPDALLSALSILEARDSFVQGGTDVAGALFVSWPDLTVGSADGISFDELRVERIIALRHESPAM